MNYSGFPIRSCRPPEADWKDSCASTGFLLLVFCKVNVQILSPFAFLDITGVAFVDHSFKGFPSDWCCWVQWVHIVQVPVDREPVRTSNILAWEIFRGIFNVCSTVSRWLHVP